jgi:hypothetical protein
MAKFVAAINGFISPELVIRATDKGVKERTPEQVRHNKYNLQFVSAIDPAFRHDSFTYSVFHRLDDGTVVQDFLKVWTPDIKKNIKLDPDEIVGEIAQYNAKWGITITYSDQYQLESLQQLARRKGFEILGNDFTGKSKPKMFGSLKNLLRINKLRLLDKPIIYQQLTRLQQKNTALGGIQISAPRGAHDDVAAVIALGTQAAIQLYPVKKEEKKETTLEDLCMAQISRNNKLKSEGLWVGFDPFLGT